MVTQPAYLKNLKTFVRTQFGADKNPMLSVQSVMGESDRGAVILAATSVEDMLEWICVSKMRGLLLDEAAREAMFGVNGCAGTFSNKIAMAYALGAIDKDMRRHIDLIREMRNACAHARQTITFDTPELRAVCKVLIAEVISNLRDRNDPGALRFCFTLHCVLICQFLAGGPPVDMATEIRNAIRKRAVESA